MIQKDGLNGRVNGTSTHARQLVAVFQVLCALYRLAKTKRTLHGSRELSFNELTNAKILCCIVAILVSTEATARLCTRRAL